MVVTCCLRRDSNDLETVECPSTTFCIAADGDGNVFRYNGATWTGPDNIDGGNMFQDISCVSTAFCVAVDNDGNAFTFNGSSWSGDDIGGTAQLPSVACPTTSFCVAGDTLGDVYMFNGSSWSPENIDDNVIVALSCPTTSFCVATDDAGYAMTYGWVSASYSCDFPGLGSTPTSVLVSESPSPPPSITAPGRSRPRFRRGDHPVCGGRTAPSRTGPRASRSGPNRSRQTDSRRLTPRAVL